MSSKDTARRTEIIIYFAGVDISQSIRPYLLTMTYTDNEEDRTDDLQITLDDRDRTWVRWLSTPAPTIAEDSSGWKVGDTVIANGRPQYSSYGGQPGVELTNYQGKITLLNLKDGVPYPIHVDQKGWFAESQVQKDNEIPQAAQEGGSAKGAKIRAFIIQKNWNGTGKDRKLDCGVFELDSIDFSGPPGKVSMKATSIPYSSTMRMQIKTKAWENVKLSTIANDLAGQNGMQCMYESSYDPLYTRKEQVKKTDLVFLQELCKSAGISLKVTSNTIVLFDAAEYEQKPPVLTISYGNSDITRASFGTSYTDTAYSSCHVAYEDPQTGQKIEGEYQQPGEGSGQVLEVNERVTSAAEAKELAKKRLRQKNKGEVKAEFTLVGNGGLVAGLTGQVEGYGFFDGKYIIETATHNPTGGYSVGLKLRRVLEGY